MLTTKDSLIGLLFVIIIGVAIMAVADRPATGAGEVIATVLGKPITADQLIAAETEYNRERMPPAEFASWQTSSRHKLLLSAICHPLLEAYAQRNGLSPTAAEQRAFDQWIRAQSQNEHPEAAPKVNAKKVKSMRFWRDQWITNWKTSHALWNEHGGTLGISSFGFCLPFEARLVLLKEEAEAKRLVFHDEAIEKLFWRLVSPTTREEKRREMDGVIDDPAKVEEFLNEKLSILSASPEGAANPSKNTAE